MTTAAHAEPDWVATSIWWHVYPLGFVGAFPAAREPGRHGLRRIVDWLDYALELGVNGVALGPIFTSHTHGYDTIDHLRIDPRLGDDADFDHLVAGLRDRGMRLMLDGVFNHVGRGFERLIDAGAQGPESPDAAWFRVESWQPGQEPRFASFEGHGDLVALNHDHPAVADYVAQVMTHWLDRGADAWRLDAAYAVPARFWAHVVPRVRDQHPHAYVVGEVLHGEYDRFVTEAGIDAVTQYELWKSTWSSLNDGNFYELDWTLQRHNAWLDTFVPLTFVGNHDVTRIASQLRDQRHLGHSLALLMTVGGTPTIYYGDEQAFTGVKEERFGGDDSVRPQFPGSPDELAPYGWEVFRLHQRMVGLRRRHPWLHAARTTVLHLANEQYAYRVTGADAALMVAVNIADQEWRLALPAGAGELLESQDARIDGTDLVVGPHAWAVVS